MDSKNELIKLLEIMNQPNKRLQFIKLDKLSQSRNSNFTYGKNHIWKYCGFNFKTYENKPQYYKSKRDT